MTPISIIPYSTSSSYLGQYSVSVRRASENSICNFSNPANGAVWASGGQTIVQWARDTAVFGQLITLQFYRGVTFLETIISNTTNDGLYTWFVPSGIASGSDYRIRISASQTGEPYGFSGSYTIITWSAQVSAGGTVDIFLFDASGIVMTIGTGVSNTGVYSWLLPASLNPASTYYIRVISSLHSAIGGMSGVFTIAP